jgi:hypothetical protein
MKKRNIYVLIFSNTVSVSYQKVKNIGAYPEPNKSMPHSIGPILYYVRN